MLSLSPSPRRLTAAFVALALVFGLFGVRLVYLHGLRYEQSRSGRSDKVYKVRQR